MWRAVRERRVRRGLLAMRGRQQGVREAFEWWRQLGCEEERRARKMIGVV